MKGKKRFAYFVLGIIFSCIIFLLLIAFDVVGQVGQVSKDFAKEALLYILVGWTLSAGITYLASYLRKKKLISY